MRNQQLTFDFPTADRPTDRPEKRDLGAVRPVAEAQIVLEISNTDDVTAIDLRSQAARLIARRFRLPLPTAGLVADLAGIGRAAA